MNRIKRNLLTVGLLLALGPVVVAASFTDIVNAVIKDVNKVGGTLITESVKSVIGVGAIPVKAVEAALSSDFTVDEMGLTEASAAVGPLEEDVDFKIAPLPMDDLKKLNAQMEKWAGSPLNPSKATLNDFKMAALTLKGRPTPAFHGYQRPTVVFKHKKSNATVVSDWGVVQSFGFQPLMVELSNAAAR